MYHFLFLSSLLTPKELDRIPNIVDIMDTTEKKKTEKKNSFAKLGTQNYDKALKYLKRKKKKNLVEQLTNFNTTLMMHGNVINAVISR